MKLKTIYYEGKYLNHTFVIDYITSEKKDITEAFYFLDGQNAFLDKKATYKRSLRANRYLKHIKDGYIAIAIHCPYNDRDRLNNYSPFIIENSYLTDFINNPELCHLFIKELILEIIPMLEKNYKIKNRHLIASSLAASFGTYLNSIDDSFNHMALFSIANFLFKKEMQSHLKKHPISNARLFIAVGENEESDGCYDKELYLNTALDYKKYLDTIKANYEFFIYPKGKHHESSWEKYFKEYLKRVYN